jgi:hypothetical protein
LTRDPKPEPDVHAEVNGRIYEYAAERSEPEDAWDFVCECGRRDCHERVTLTLAKYESLRASPGRVLAPGHD